MAFIHDLTAGEPLTVGPYDLELAGTSPGDQPTVEIVSRGPEGKDRVTIDRATWYIPEEGETRPNSPQYRRDPGMIHVSVVKDGDVLVESAEICVEAPDGVDISPPG